MLYLNSHEADLFGQTSHGFNWTQVLSRALGIDNDFSGEAFLPTYIAHWKIKLNQKELLVAILRIILVNK